MTKFFDLVGKVLFDVQGLEEGSESVGFTAEDGSAFILSHHQDCCEDVRIVDVCGDVEDLIGVPILEAEESTSDEPAGRDVCAQWTFYKLSTIKGSVTIRWYGESNGYYSVGVAFHEVDVEAERRKAARALETLTDRESIKWLLVGVIEKMKEAKRD